MKTLLLLAITDSWLMLGTFICFAAAVVIFVFHEFRVIGIKNPKDRYDYVNTHEIRYFGYAVIALIAALTLFLNEVVGPLIPVSDSMLPIVRVFFMAGFAVIAYLALGSVVRLLYPSVIDRRLNRIRNTPRLSPAGNVMRKLSAAEGSVHLDQQQIAEQASDLHSTDYDVWVDEKTGYKQVEKYLGYQHAEKCGECGFFTLRVASEEILRKPTQSEDGLLEKHYRCSYCNHRERRDVAIAKLSTNA
jgi:hypothetical protein